MNIQKTIQEITEWAAYNFDTHIPELGMVEEIGEYAHQLLKAAQSIRETSDADAKDALADIGIYFLHLCGLKKIILYTDYRVAERTLWYHIGKLSQHAGKILECAAEDERPDSNDLEAFWSHLKKVAQISGWDLHDLIKETWAQVSKRDWRKYPKTGFPPQPENSGTEPVGLV